MWHACAHFPPRDGGSGVRAHMRERGKRRRAVQRMPDLCLRLLLVLDKGIALDEARAAIEGKIQLLDFAMVRKLVIQICLHSASQTSLSSLRGSTRCTAEDTRSSGTQLMGAH
jgi:hypothetical protein